ncbi:hypothetical protein QF035_004645 [Streptomyces umbrinus]|uniref:Transposase n=1 Tax=Streptomyces umbrinus TaxID=67370 RepID=A0ABU0SU53_9ACTN|nr:hypothetical protein [Streptomyces umbrinus]
MPNSVPSHGSWTCSAVSCETRTWCIDPTLMDVPRSLQIHVRKNPVADRILYSLLTPGHCTTDQRSASPPPSLRPSTHHPPPLPSRPPSTHTPWSGRGSGRQGGARHCTNDLDALGHGCSALPGLAVDGMEAPRARHTRLALANGAPSIPESERPRRRHLCDRGCVRAVIATHQTGLSTRGRVGAAPAARAEGRSAGAARAGKRARRSGAQPGLDEVGKVLSRWDEALVVRSR